SASLSLSLKNSNSRALTGSSACDMVSRSFKEGGFHQFSNLADIIKLHKRLRNNCLKYTYPRSVATFRLAQSPLKQSLYIQRKPRYRTASYHIPARVHIHSFKFTQRAQNMDHNILFCNIHNPVLSYTCFFINF